MKMQRHTCKAQLVITMQQRYSWQAAMATARTYVSRSGIWVRWEMGVDQAHHPEEQEQEDGKNQEHGDAALCAGYLGYPFQNQEGNRHAATRTTPIWSVDWKEK